MRSTESIRNLATKSPVKACDSDPMPTHNAKTCVVEFLPTKSGISHSDSHVPDAWKEALFKCELKQLESEPVFKYYRPLSNLPFVSLLTEKVIVQQSMDHLMSQYPLPVLQSAYR